MLNFFLFLAEGIVLTEALRGGDFLGKGPAIFMLTSCASRYYRSFLEREALRNGWALRNG